MKKFLCGILTGTLVFWSLIANAQPNDDSTNALALELSKNSMNKKNLPLSLEARYFSFGADGHLNSSDVNLNGGEVGLKNDLDLLNDRAAEIIFRYKNFSLDYLRMNKTGGGDFPDGSPLNFGGQSYRGETSAENNLHYIKLNVDNEIISFLGTGATWSYGLTGVYWDGSVGGGGQSSGKNYFVPLPTVGLGLHMAIMRKMKIYTQLSGMHFGGRGHLFDFEAGLRYSPSKNFSLTAGFRNIGVQVRRGSDSGNFKMSGPFIGLRSDF